MTWSPGWRCPTYQPATPGRSKRRGTVADRVWTGSVRLGFFLGGLVVLALGVAGRLRALRDEGRGSHE